MKPLILQRPTLHSIASVVRSQYCYDDDVMNGIVCNRDAVGAWEKFTFETYVPPPSPPPPPKSPAGLDEVKSTLCDTPGDVVPECWRVP